MKPLKFEEANLTLTAPEGMENEVIDLPVWTDGQHCLSCWKLSFYERLVALFSGKVWFWAIGKTHPPILLTTANPKFKK